MMQHPRSILSMALTLLILNLAIHSIAADETAEQTRYKTAANILYREGVDLTEDVQKRCRLDVYYPDGERDFATVVWFHGGGLTNGIRSVPTPLKEQGLGVVAVSYRLSPHVKSPVYVEDAAAAVAWTFKHIGEYGGSNKLIFVSGHSAGGYLTSMLGLDKRWLAAHEIDANQIAGLVPFSGHAITHYTVRKERGIADTQPVVDDMAPLFHVRKDAPPLLLITGDRDLEMLGRYEENAYLWRMMQVAGHERTQLEELKGFNHGQMAAPAFPLLIEFVEKIRDSK